MNERMYLLKIRLTEIEPEIWRRFVVPGDITLDRLHDVIQIVMGWTNSHLHLFTIGKRRFTESPEQAEDGLESGKHRLVDLIKQKGSTFRYLYDFGDHWEHEIVIEDSHFPNSNMRTEMVCLDGERACPPEDVGGVPGYMDFCNALNNPDHEEHERYMEWSGGNYDSEHFSTRDINLDLLKFRRWSRDRHQIWRKYLYL